MKQKTKASIMTAAALLLLAGCQKDDLRGGQGDRLMLNLEAFGGSGSKTVLSDDDRSLQWLSGDRVCINGTDYAVTVAGGDAYVANVPEAATYKAVFPASMVEGKSMTGSTVTATLPRQYEYRTQGGLQVLDAPLAAVGDGNDGLTFRHLTGALSVVVTNNTSNTLYIDTVYLSSAQQLCGDVTIDFDNITAVGPNTSPANAADTMVMLTVPYNTLSVAAGASVKVQLPVLPVSDANRFTVHVATRHEGTRYDFDRRQGSANNALGRNQMGYVPASIATSGSYISVLPLAYIEAGDTYWVESPLDFLLFRDATQNGWIDPLIENEYSKYGLYFYKTIDMEGYTITTIYMDKGLPGQTYISGAPGVEINNLTIDGNYLFAPSYTEFLYISRLTFNNVTVNSTSGSAALLLDYADVDYECFIADVVVNGLTFNINTLGNSYIGGLVMELQSNHSMTDCSVTDIDVNFIRTASSVSFGGLVAYNNLFNNGYNGIYRCSYVQNKPLVLTASAQINYGGAFSSSLDWMHNNEQEFCHANFSGNLVHNVSLNAPAVVCGGIAGYLSEEEDLSFTWNNDNPVTQSGTIDIYASSAYRADKKVDMAISVSGPFVLTDDSGHNWHEVSFTYNGTVNDDALTITAH